MYLSGAFIFLICTKKKNLKLKYPNIKLLMKLQFYFNSNLKNKKGKNKK